MLGGLTAVLVPFFALWVGVLLALTSRPSMGFGADEFARLALMSLATLLYVTLFFSMGVIVSALARSSSSALIILLFLWAVVVFAIPHVGNLVAEQISPPPSAETQEQLRRQAFVKNRFIAIQSENRDREGNLVAFNREYDRLVEDYRVKLDAMVRTGKTICRVSPAATLTYVFTDLAGTGLGEQRRLSRALMEFKNRNLRALNELNMRYVPAYTPFDFRPARLADVFAHGVLTDFALLALMCATLFAGAIFAFLKVDPR